MMAPRSAGRPASGLLRKERSVTALRAFIAGALEQRHGGAYLRELGVDVAPIAVTRAAAPVRWRPASYQRPGPKTASPPPSPRPENVAVRDWMAVNPERLELEAGFVVVDAASRRAQRSVYQRLQRVVGVVQLLATSAGKARQVVALVLVDGANDRRRLEDQLDELVADWAWQYVDLQTVEPAVATWRHLAREAARREQLAL
jgi:hypothetical protein